MFRVSLDLGGDVKKNPKISGTTHNVFGIQVGVSINLLVRRRSSTPRRAQVRYAAVGEDWRKEQKLQYLDEKISYPQVEWAEITPDDRFTWLGGSLVRDFADHIAIASGKKRKGDGIFSRQSLGVNSNRDEWVYNFSESQLTSNVISTIDTYNAERHRWLTRSDEKADIDDFLSSDSKKIKWSSRLKEYLLANVEASFDRNRIRVGLYRPYCCQYFYFDRVLIHRRGNLPEMIPNASTEAENLAICVNTIGNPKPFHCLATSRLPDLHLTGDTQCFPFYSYAEDGTHRRENITDWALEQFRARYGDRSITKWDIFHYIYAVLHHPEYRERYAANLRRELPRIPFVGMHGIRGVSKAAESDTLELQRMPAPPNGEVGLCAPERRYERLSEEAREEVLSQVKAMQDAGELQYASQDDARVFRAFAKAGQRLAEIHVHYEDQPEYPLTKTEKAGKQLDWRVTKMRLSKDKTTLIYNDFLTLSDIPKETYEYRLGNRSALEWVIDQYQVSTDKRSGITNDPNREGDPEYIVRLISQVVTVSLETVTIVKALPEPMVR